MTTTTKRRSPEEILQQVQAEEDYEKRGRLKVFLGYASGVGKSFRMLDEGRRRHERGQDVVVGAVQPQRSSEIEALLSKLPIIPLQDYRGRPGDGRGDHFEAPPRRVSGGRPGLRQPARFAQPQPLAGRGATAGRRDFGHFLGEYSIHRRSARARCQDYRQVCDPNCAARFLYSADEIVVVDAPPEMCITRTEDAEADARASSQAQKLSELREIALLLAADVVDRQLEQYLHRHGITQTFGAQERVLVCITPRANGAVMIASGRRNADRFHGDLTVAYVRQTEISPDDKSALERNLAIARDAMAHIEILDGEDPVETILQFARDHGITQVFVGHSTQVRWWERYTGTPLDRLIRGANDIDVRVFPH